METLESDGLIKDVLKKNVCVLFFGEVCESAGHCLFRVVIVVVIAERAILLNINLIVNWTLASIQKLKLNYLKWSLLL